MSQPRAVPIPEELVWAGAARQSIAPPRGFEDECGACDAVIDHEGLGGGPRFSMRIKLEPEHLEQLQTNPHLWLHLHVGQLVPFSIQTEEEIK